MRDKEPASARLEDFNHLIVEEREDRILGSGIVRVYKLPNGYGLNGINTPLAHKFPYAWEFAVLEPAPSEHYDFGDVVFDTPLTSTIKVCRTEEEAAQFIKKAVEWASSFSVIE